MGTGFEGFVHIYDLETGQSTASPSLDEDGWKDGAAFSPDDTLLAVADNGGGSSRVALWDVGTGQLVHEFVGHVNAVSDVDFSPDGRRLYTASKDTTVKIWDLETYDEIATFTGHDSELRSIDLSDDGARIVSSSGRGEVLVWDTDDFKIETELLGNNGIVDQVEFSPDGSMVLTAGREPLNRRSNITRVWNLSPAWRTELASFPPQSATDTPPWNRGALAFERSGNALTVARGDDLTTWAIADGSEIRTLPGSGASTRSVAVSPDESLLAVAGDGGAVVYDVATGALLAQPVVDTEAASVLFHPDGESLVVTGHGAVLFDLETGSRTEIIDSQFWTYAAAFDPAGTRLALSRTRDPVASPTNVTLDGLVEVFSTDTFRVVESIPFGVSSGVVAGPYRPRLTRVCSRCAHERQVVDVAFSPDGRWRAIGSISGDTLLWDTATYVQNRGLRLEGPGDLTAVVFSPSSDHLATATSDGAVRIRDVETGEVGVILMGDRAIADVEYSPDGRYLAATDADGLVTVYILDHDELVTAVERRMTRSLTDNECLQYLHVDECPETDQE